MSKIVELKKLTTEDPIDYTSKLNVYFIFDGFLWADIPTCITTATIFFSLYF